MNATQARVKLDILEARVVEAKQRYRDARERHLRTSRDGPDVADQLGRRHAAALHRQAARPSVEEEQAMTRAVLDRIRDDGLVLEPLDPRRPRAGLRVVDPTPALEEARAQAEANRARAERDDFANRVAHLLKKDDDRRKMQAIQDALEGEDPAVLRDALAAALPGHAETSESTLTTEDL